MSKYILFYYQEYDDINHYYTEVLEEKLDVAQKIIKEDNYEILGVSDTKPKAKKLTIQNIIRFWRDDLINIDNEEIKANYHKEKAKEEQWMKDTSNITVSCFFGPSTLHYTSGEWVEKEVKKYRAINRETRRRMKLAEEWNENQTL